MAKRYRFLCRVIPDEIIEAEPSAIRIGCKPIFDTWEEAHAALVERAEAELRRVIEMVESTKEQSNV